MRLTKIKKLADHNAAELDVLATMTAGPWSGMSMAIEGTRSGHETKAYTLYYFRDGLSRVGWLAVVDSPHRHEIWSFVVPKFRRKGFAIRMFDLMVAKLTPLQRTYKYDVHGYHAVAADKFYRRCKVHHPNMNLNMLEHYC